MTNGHNKIELTTQTETYRIASKGDTVRKLSITRAELKNTYDTMTVLEACEHLQISIQTYYSLLDQAGIPRKLPRRNGSTRAKLVD